MDDAQSSRRDLRSVKSDGQRGRNKPWTRSQKHIVEIMCGLALYTASERKLTVEQVVNRAGILFKNVEPNSDMKQNFHLRLEHVMAKSRFISQEKTSRKNTIWEFKKKKTKEFMEMVNKFVDEKPELAEEHNVKESSSYSSGNSRKRGHAAVSPPDSASNAPVVPKKRGSNIAKIKSVRENKKEVAIDNIGRLDIEAAAAPSDNAFDAADQMIIDPADIPLPVEAYPLADRRRSLNSTGNAGPAEPEVVVLDDGVNFNKQLHEPAVALRTVRDLSSVRVPREASSSASILQKKRSAFAPTLVSDIVAYNERDAAKKAFALRELEEILDNVATKDDVKKLTNEVKEHIQNTIGSRRGSEAHRPDSAGDAESRVYPSANPESSV